MADKESMSEIEYVFDANIEKLATRVEKLNRRASKMGVPAIQLHIGTREKVYSCHGREPRFSTDPKAWGEDAEIQEHVRAAVSLHGDPPKLSGWTFVAVVDHLSNGTITRYPLADGEIDLKPFRGSEATCDHCQVNRKRHETFIVNHESGSLKRVGRNCLADFLGHSNPSALIGHLNLWAKAFEALEGAYAAGCGAGEPVMDLRSFLGYVAREIRLHGWTSRGKAYDTGARATADTASSVYWSRFGDAQPTDEDKIRAQTALDWARKLTDADVEDNDYLYNLRAVCESDTIRPKRAGLAGSVIVSAERALGLNQAAPIRSNLHRGTVGKRETEGLTLTGTQEINGFYGVSTLHRFEDAAGNLIVWFASNPYIVPDGPEKRLIEVGETLDLSFTVKGHDEFKGRKQTKVNRVTLPKRARKVSAG